MKVYFGVRFSPRSAWLESTEDGKGLYYREDVCNFDNFIEDEGFPVELLPHWRGMSTGCCLINKFGHADYYYHPYNIKIFGY